MLQMLMTEWCGRSGLNKSHLRVYFRIQNSAIFKKFYEDLEISTLKDLKCLETAPNMSQS